MTFVFTVTIKGKCLKGDNEMNNMLPMLYETLFGFACLFLLTKVLGKTQISQLTAFDFIAALVLGELVGNALFDEKAGIFEIGYVIILWGGLLYIVEMTTQKFKRTRNLLEGKPAIIINKGQLIREEMRKNKIDIGELQHMLRTNNAFSIQEIEYAIMESNGTVSVLKKSAFQTPTRSDLNVAPVDVELATTIISDREIIYDNLSEKGLTEDWLEQEIKRQGFNKVEDIFYAEYIKDKKLFIQAY